MVSQTIAATPPLLPVKMAYRSPKTDLTRGVSQKKLASEAHRLSGLPNANAKSQRFNYATSQIATLPPVVTLNRSSKSQIAARYAAFWHAVSQIALASFL